MIGGGSHLGIDIGTQGARAVLVTAEGSVIARAEHPLEVPAPGPVQEQSPAQWWDALVAVIHGLGDHRGSVGSLAISCTSGSVCAIDDRGRAIGPGLLYSDRRAAARAGVDPSWAAAKIGWLLDEGADQVRGATVFTSPGGYLTTRLLGRPTAIDVTQALKFGFDPETACWSPVAVATDSLPEVLPTGTVLGELSAAAARVTGLHEDTIVVVGATDGIAGQFACRPSPQRWAISIGSTIVWKAMADRRIDAVTEGVYSHRGPDGWWLPGAASSAGARVLSQWATQSELDAMAASVVLDPADDASYPGSGRGERFPFVDPDFEPWSSAAVATGAPIDRYRAEVLGIALVERWGCEILIGHGCLPPTSVATTGGLGRTAALNRLRADVLQVPIEVPAEASSAFGAAIIAASVAHGGVLPAAESMVRFIDRVEPDRTRAERWTDSYERFRMRCRENQRGGTWTNTTS